MTLVIFMPLILNIIKNFMVIWIISKPPEVKVDVVIVPKNIVIMTTKINNEKKNSGGPRLFSYFYNSVKAW